jgi:hypothetical protein
MSVGPNSDKGFLHDLFGKVATSDYTLRYSNHPTGFLVENTPQRQTVTLGTCGKRLIQIIPP